MRTWIMALCITLLCATVAFAAEISVWSEGQPAAGTANVLKPNDPFAIDLPAFVAPHINEPTALFYFSPTCPHCQNVMSEVNGLAQSGIYDWIGIAASSSSQAERSAFETEYTPQFPILHDSEGLFASSVMARATPNIYIVQPTSTPLKLGPDFELIDAYLPFSRGTGGVLKIRSQLERPFTHFQGYQGNMVCGSCHQQEFLSWSLSHHARAYYTLAEQDQLDNAECVSCHVVGLGEPTGFVLGDHHSPLRDVGCESCHGPSGPHDGERTDALESCEGCHDDKHSIAFSVEKGLPHIDHFMANGMDDMEIKARVTALQNGTLERPLLAFPNEQTVGAAVCSNCHSDSHPNDPHADAMKTLPRKSRKDVNCVACHATGVRSGPKSNHLADYRTDESVGCESCHGPGAAHAEHPSQENIVGLGESCPVCVIEAVCTSCHTAEWDPDWDLDRRLKQYSDLK